MWELEEINRLVELASWQEEGGRMPKMVGGAAAQLVQ